MKPDRIILLHPEHDPRQEIGRTMMTRKEALDEIVEGLEEGAYVLHASSSDRQHSMIVHDGDRLSHALGGRGDLPMSILVCAHADGSDGDPVTEAMRVLTSPTIVDHNSGPLKRIKSIACAIACASAGGRPQDDDSLLFLTTASPWGRMAVASVDGDDVETAIEIDPAIRRMMPMVVSSTWKVLGTGETVLEIGPLLVTVWSSLRVDAMEAMRILSDLEREPLIA